MTPDGRPVVGRGRYDNLVYNAGHGHMGWTMACGTARIVSDVVAGRKSEIDVAGLAPRPEVGGL
jgi:D-amino-acid dehydrogenase